VQEPKEADVMTITNKKLVRSYSVAPNGDLVVISWNRDGHRSDMSKDYEELPRNRHLLLADAFLDVFRHENGELSWAGSPNGHTPSSAVSWKLLMDAFVEDLGSEGTARGF